MFLTNKKGREEGLKAWQTSGFKRIRVQIKKSFYVNEMLNTAADTVALKSFNHANERIF